MSVRAHRVINIKTADATFDMWHDVEVVKWLERNTGFLEPLFDGTGLTEVRVDDLEEMLEEIGDKISEDVKKNLVKDIKIAKKQGNEFISYLCY